MSSAADIGALTTGTATAQLIALAISLAIGLLIGIERGWVRRNAAAGQRVAGVRTYGLLGLSGGLLALLGTQQPLLAAVAAAALLGLVALGYWSAFDDPDRRSITDAVVSVMTLCLGALAVSGEARVAIVAAGSVVVLLASREKLHGWLRSLDDTDIRASAQFVLIALVVLPLLPDVGIGPYGSLNPRNLWLVVVFVTGISFAGYWAGKRLGSARGTLITAVIGATYSSTAVTTELSRRLRSAEGSPSVLNAGIAAATVVMLLRVLVLAAILTPLSFPTFARIVVPAALVTSPIAFWRARRVIDDKQTALATANPFTLGPAIGFAALVAIIIVASHWAIEHFGKGGLATVLGLTGLYDVDSAIVTVSNLGDAPGMPERAAMGLALAILVNTTLKAVIVIVLAGPRRGAKAALPLAVSALVLITDYLTFT